MILAEFHTKSGVIYTADVVNRKIKSIDAKGVSSNWFDYTELKDGSVGQKLRICWDSASYTESDEIASLKFPVVERTGKEGQEAQG